MGWRVATAFSPVGKIISVSGLVAPRVSPQSAPCGPVERVFVERIPCPDAKQLAASVGGPRPRELRFLVDCMNCKLAHAFT